MLVFAFLRSIPPLSFVPVTLAKFFVLFIFDFSFLRFFIVLNFLSIFVLWWYNEVEAIT